MHFHEFDRVYSILEASFPPDEYRGYDAQKALLDNPCYTVYVYPQNSDIIALITVWQFEKFSFIEHFAVDPFHRNGGLGTALLTEIVRMLPNDLCLEAELPQTEIARRRLAFYRRNGFIPNDFPYMQPAYSLDKNPVPLVIMTQSKSLSPEQFHYIENTLHERVYGVCKKENG